LETFEESKKVVPLTSPTIRPGLPVWLFLGQICNFGLFQLLWLFFFLKKGQMKFGFFGLFGELDYLCRFGMF